MGKSTKLTTDQKLAQEHAAGATVTVIQVLAHEQLGTIDYQWPRHWVFHLSISRRAADELARLHEVVLALPIDRSGMRSIHDLVLLEDVYEAGCSLVIHSMLALQHLCEEIERTLQIPAPSDDLTDRVDSATRAAGLAIGKQSDGYAAFIELLKMRNAVEHPKPENTYSSDPNGWDRVPLAWSISDRSLRAAQRHDTFVCDLADQWEERREQLATPATLDVDGRGLRSERPYKKPRLIRSDAATSHRVDALRHQRTTVENPTAVSPPPSGQ